MANGSRAECETLLGLVLSFAEQMLRESGGFHTFGAGLAIDGELLSVGAFDGEEPATSADELRRLKDACIKDARSGRCKATALTYNVRLSSPDSGEQGDAITVLLDHRDGYSLIVLVPYRIEAGATVFSDMIVETGANDIFSPRPLS